MQIREILLTELEEAYEVLKELRTALSYDEYEDLVYEMRHQEYKIFGLYHQGVLSTYAGVSVHVNLYYKRHLFLYDLVTTQQFRSQGHGKEMLCYLEDYAKINNCERLVLSSNLTREAAHRFYEKEGYTKIGYTITKTL